MVVDGAVVMIENIVRHLSRTSDDHAHAAAEDSRRRARSAAPGLLRHRHHHHRVPADLHAAAVEGRLFKPMAWTVAFALLGALIFSMLVAPVLASLLFSKGAKEWENPVMGWLTSTIAPASRWAIEHRAITVGIACLCLSRSFSAFGGAIGSEFLPHLDEGAIWVRGTLPQRRPHRQHRLHQQGARRAGSFPEVTQVVSQTGRPDDGTDTPASSTPNTSSI
jgi:cobalt-zinc-cadmium resistance protein CzcA